MDKVTADCWLTLLHAEGLAERCAARKRRKERKGREGRSRADLTNLASARLESRIACLYHDSRERGRLSTFRNIRFPAHTSARKETDVRAGK